MIVNYLQVDTLLSRAGASGRVKEYDHNLYFIYHLVIQRSQDVTYI